MREKKKQEIIDYCNEKGIELINLRNMKKQGKTRIVITFRCKVCGTRYDMTWDNVKTQEFPGYCTKCAHKESQNYRRLQAQSLIDKFKEYGYKVLTPLDCIRPKGKAKTLNKVNLLVEDKFGYQFEICYNNFIMRLDQYIKYNEDNNNYYQQKHTFEEIVAKYLEELRIPFKREFIFNDCKGKKNHLMRFDFCLFFTCPDKRMIIEIDEKHHAEEEVKERDKIKDIYCFKNGIPILRIYYLNIKNSELYKQQINNFLENYAK